MLICLVMTGKTDIRMVLYIILVFGLGLFYDSKKDDLIRIALLSHLFVI